MMPTKHKDDLAKIKAEEEAAIEAEARAELRYQAELAANPAPDHAMTLLHDQAQAAIDSALAAAKLERDQTTGRRVFVQALRDFVTKLGA